LEGVKLDLKTLESRLFTLISQQESKFDDINSMHVKQEEMESAMKQKDEEIHKPKLEIQYIKGKLFLERSEAQNAPTNNDHGSLNALNKTLNNSKNKDLCSEIINIADDPPPPINDPPTNLNKNQSSLNTSKTYSSNNKDQHANYETNTTTSMNIMSKNDTPCPFLLRRGWCLKKQNCDFKHPQYSHQNHPSNRVP
jgi:chromosome segregation ATPase